MLYKHKSGFIKLLSLVTAVSLLFSITACSKSDNETTKPSAAPSKTQQPSGSASTEADAASSPEQEAPQYGGIFTIGLASEQRGFDSALFNYGATNHLKQTSNTLIEGDWTKGPSGEHLTDFDTSTAPLAVSFGALAESWEFIGEDTIVFHIRPNVHFGLNPNSEASRLVNGRELTAEDVAFSFRRQFNLEPSAPTPKAYAYTRLTQDEFPTSIEVTDKYTVTVKGKPGFIGSLFYWLTEMTGIYAPEVVAKYGDLNNVLNDVGTGPFYVTEYVQNSSITFARNSNYWQKDPLGAGKGNQLPYLDGVRYLVLPDLSTRLSAFRTGQLDYIRDVSLDDFKQLIAENPDLKYSKTVGTGGGLTLRTDKPDQPWYDVRVRQAIQLGTDRQAIINDYYGGEASLINFPVSDTQTFRSLGAYVGYDDLPANVQKLFNYNPEKAKQLLKEAGYPDGFEINVVLNASQIDLASVLKSQLEKIGIVLNLEVKEDAVYTSISSGRTFEEGIFGGGSGATPQAFHNFRPDDAGNTAMIDDPIVNKLIADFADKFMIADDESWPLIGEATPYILEQSWYLTLPAPYTFQLWWPWVKNYNGEYSLGGGHFYNFTHYIWIDQELKKSLGY
jgi:peptide/nickel transport system substrate-binding protein